MAHQVDDTTPLLQDVARSPSPSPEPTARRWSKDILRPSPTIIMMAFLAYVEFGAVLVTLPTNSMIEQAVCNYIYKDSGVSASNTTENRCKSPAVQTELSFITYWAYTLALFPSVLLSIPYGRLGDTLGRVPVLRWSLLGIVLSALCETIVYAFPSILPPRAIWLAPLCNLIGGGQGVLSAMVFTSIADTTPENERSTAFSYIAVVMTVSQLIATPLASVLMDRNPWLCLIVGNAVFIGTIPFSYGLRETLKRPEMPLPDPNADDSTTKPTLYGRTKLAMRALLSMDLSFAWKNRSVLLLLIVILFTTLGKYTNLLILQYATNRYKWEWSKANYLTMIEPAVNIVALSLLLPWLSALFDRKIKLVAASRDVWLLRGATAIITCGLILMGLSATPTLLIIGITLLSLGTTSNVLIRSTITSFAGGHNTAALYNIIGSVSNLGNMIAGPILGEIFNHGIRLGGFGLGLPFLTAGGFFLLSFMLEAFVRVPVSIQENEGGPES